jgi:hypothetical protein
MNRRKAGILFLGSSCLILAILLLMQSAFTKALKGSLANPATKTCKWQT